MLKKPAMLQLALLLAMIVASYWIVREYATTQHADMERSEAVAAATGLPPVTFTNEAGENVTLDDFRGQPVLVNLWAIWCPPCVAELPALSKLQARLRNHNFRVVPIAIGRYEASEIRAFFDDKGIIALDSYIDSDRQIATKWRYKGIPVSYLIDAQGRVAEAFEGPREWDSDDMVAKVSALLKL